MGNACTSSSDGRVVKALDLKSNGVSPRRFEPCSLRPAGGELFSLTRSSLRREDFTLTSSLTVKRPSAVAGGII